MVGRAQAQRNHVVALLLELPLLLAGKAVAGKLDLAAAHGHCVTVTKATADRETNGRLARPDRRIALPQVLATIGFNRSERSSSRAQCHTNRTVIKNKLHRSLPFLTPARRVNRADRKPARAPSQKREPSIEKLQNAGYRQNEAHKLSKQTCYRSNLPYQNASQQQR